MGKNSHKKSYAFPCLTCKDCIYSYYDTVHVLRCKARYFNGVIPTPMIKRKCEKFTDKVERLF